MRTESERTRRWNNATKSFQMVDAVKSEELSQDDRDGQDLIQKIAFGLEEFVESPDGKAARRLLGESVLYVDILDLDGEEGTLIFGFFGFAILPPETEESDEEDGDEEEHEEGEPLLTIVPIRYKEVADILINKGMVTEFMPILEEKLNAVADSAPRSN